MGALSPAHWMIVIGVLVLLFGAKRLPDAARSVGRSARILKAEIGDMSPGRTGIDGPAATGSTALPASKPSPPATAGRDPGRPDAAQGPAVVRDEEGRSS